MNGPCKEFADRIVDYVDGELPQDETQAVGRHLVACEPCRRTAEALNRSLGLAKVLWSDNLDDRERTQAAPAPRLYHIRVYAVAASVLIAASVLVLVVGDHYSRSSLTRSGNVERQVADVGAAAELLAATQILARCEGTEALVERQYRFILKEYAGTPAAESIRTRLSPESRRYTQ
ncbi:MAG TPA: zf-HC2 domain-containing protein [Sedimentisphaerales bacterium]|nr:zf-HC2 domain-containing protein [Sedimentisphaerales bacterium]